jgi:hypothetical protein
MLSRSQRQRGAGRRPAGTCVGPPGLGGQRNADINHALSPHRRLFRKHLRLSRVIGLTRARRRLTPFVAIGVLRDRRAELFCNMCEAPILVFENDSHYQVWVGLYCATLAKFQEHFCIAGLAQSSRLYCTAPMKFQEALYASVAREYPVHPPCTPPVYLRPCEGIF